VLQRRTLGASVYASLKRAIIGGELLPGSRVTEKMLEQSLGVSRTPVREALARLAHERYLIARAYKGYQVNHPTPQEVSDIHQILIALVELASNLTMQRATGDELSELISLTEAMDRSLAEGDIESYGGASAAIRSRIIEMSRNKTLASLYEQLVNHPGYIRPWAIDDLAAVQRRAPDLAKLRQAIGSRDGDLVGEVLADKLRRSLADVVKDLEKPVSDSENERTNTKIREE
jgi:DNA-binding GntR family transcriptional regulator